MCITHVLLPLNTRKHTFASRDRDINSNGQCITNIFQCLLYKTFVCWFLINSFLPFFGLVNSQIFARFRDDGQLPTKTLLLLMLLFKLYFKLFEKNEDLNQNFR